MYSCASTEASLTPEVLAEGGVDARLPAGSAGAEPIDHVLVEPQRHQLFRRYERRPSAPTAKQGFAVMQIGLVEPFVRQLRHGIRILGDLARDVVIGRRVNLRQVAVDSGLALRHLLSSSSR